MKRNFISTALLLTVMGSTLCAVQATYVTAEILDIQQKTKSRELYSIVNTPVTQDDPYYEVTVQVKQTVYVGEYTPRHSADLLPEEWKIGADVRARIEKHYMYLRRDDGRELQFAIAQHHSAESALAEPHPAPAKRKF